MKIECILKRDGGSRVEFGGKEYHFAPLPDGSHVAVVDDDDAISRFLSIQPMAYRLYRETDTAPAPAPEPPNTPQPQPSVPNMQQPAPATDDGLTGGPDDTGDDRGEGENGDAGNGDGELNPADTNGDGTVTRAEATARYVSVFNKRPYNGWPVDEILKKIDDELASRG
jgi:hypothetical protein